MRGWVCLLLGLVRTIIGSKSRRTQDHILLPHMRLSQPGGIRSPYLYPSGTGWPSYTPPATVYPFRHLLQLAGLRWGYSYLPPQGKVTANTAQLRPPPSNVT
jgi:hypothetical protein